ncbi:hypothetical protein V2G26_012849 [Clonostachys chloroleuca]
MSNQEPIAIVGIGCRFPGNGNTPSALWDVLREPRDLLTPIPEDRFSVEGHYHEDNKVGGHSNVKSSYFLDGKGFHRKFDAQFFGISPVEAHALDPQVRLLLETVYEAMEDSGHSIDQLHGSDTAVYSGVLMHDYEIIMGRDSLFSSRYHSTGITLSLIANRVSYFFNWHGPSMMLDTACSSSLYAVHLAIQQLRSGGSKLAVATGCNLLLDPLPYVSQSKMGMLSPTGRSRMWDSGANGYARGEGVAAIILKPLSRAQADGDPIHAIIRETGLNQDGRTPGITVPSAKAQMALMRDCYARAGLDLNSRSDRPQYFEAHGTGTPTGDPIEAEAISTTFFSDASNEAFDPLHVGGVKTVIGHTEGTAGLASIIKVVLAMKHGIIPANLLFERLNPRIEPFIKNLRVPTAALEWPVLPENQPRRASVNSFGFGGANAHAILEGYTSKLSQADNATVFSPFIFSAASQASLLGYLISFRNYVSGQGPELSMRDLAFTLHSRRTRHAFAVSVSAASSTELLAKLDQKIDEVRKNPDDGPGVRSAPASGDGPRILGIFTGQGAQWPRMCADLITHSPGARRIIDGFDAHLAALPPAMRPDWSIAEELLKGQGSSRVHDPIVAQTICVATQLLVTDILKAAGVKFTAVVGHSSGEIAASYAAGRISAGDAILMSWHRGLSVSKEQDDDKPGAMMAVGSTQEDIQQLLDEPEFKDRAWIAAVNSGSSLTISGDADAIDEIYDVLRDESKFARRLKINRAYHSPHMIGSSKYYTKYQDTMSIKPGLPTECSWFSSVSGENNAPLHDELKGPYWVQNLLNPVLFKHAVEKAWNEKGPFDIAIEIGPHPALKGPTLQIIQDIAGRPIPYTSLLERGLNNLDSIADGLGYLSCHVGKGVVDLKAYDAFLSDDTTFNVLQDLPPYSWNHSTEYWHMSRQTSAIAHRPDKVHELLGHLTPDSTEREQIWRHSICPRELPWLSGHRVQGQIVYPGAAYIVTVIEACLKLTTDQSVSLIEVLDITMGQALTFDDDESQVEVIFSLTDIENQKNPSRVTGNFNCSAAKAASDSTLDSLAHGKFCILLGAPSDTALPGGSSHPTNLLSVDSDTFYTATRELDYDFSGHFRGLSDVKRKHGVSTGFLPGVNAPSMLVHPAMLDALFQSIVAAVSAPNDGRLMSAHIPNHIDAVRVNPSLCEAQRQSSQRPAFEAVCELSSNLSSVKGHSNLFPQGSDYSMLAVEGVNMVALSRATAENDRVMFASTPLELASPDISQLDVTPKSINEQLELAKILLRVACFYLRMLEQGVPVDDPSRMEGPYTPFFQYASHTLKSFRDGAFSLWTPDWEADTFASIDELLASCPRRPDVQLLQALGPKLADIVMGHASPIEIGMEDDQLGKYYKTAFGMQEALSILSPTVGQILHRYPRVRCLEVGAGTASATQAILREHGDLFSEYTFTDISSGFFPAAQANLGELADRVLFKPLDINQDPCSQGFEPHSYDMIIASMVLHATPYVTKTLENVRRLLKPGGYLVVLEIQKNIPAYSVAIFGAFTGWWVGADDGRALSPCLDVPEWNELLCRSGFSGCDTSLFDPNTMVNPVLVFVSQAVDERVAGLRNPLANPPPQKIFLNIVILGGKAPKSSSIVQQLTSLLLPFYASILHYADPTEIPAEGLDSETLLLSLLDLDKPFFQDLSEASWVSMRTSLEKIGSLVWVTRGRLSTNPHSNLMVGLLRSAPSELPHLTTQFLDFEDDSELTAHNLATTVLQFAGATWLKKEGGRVMIPRMKTEEAMNNRYNASRRAITSKIPATRACIGKGPMKRGYYVREDRTLESARKTEGPEVRVSHSFLKPIRFRRDVSLFLSIGERTDTGEQVLSLSLSNGAVVRPEAFVKLETLPSDSSPITLLRLVSLYQISSLVFGDSDEGEKILVHDADPALQDSLRAEGRRRNIDVLCTTTSDHVSGDPYQLHPNAAARSIRALQPHLITSFVDFGVTGEAQRVSQRILLHLNVACRRETAKSIFGGFTRKLSKSSTEAIQSTLQDAISHASSSLSDAPTENAYTILPKDVDKIDLDIAHRYIINWGTEAEVEALVEPADTFPLFSKETTYWLVGLTGTLGCSLCQWMLRNGARYFVLTSRNPKIEPGWLEAMASQQAIIKVTSCDITIMQDLQKTYEDICSSMPPIRGVFQGSMVLHDIGLPNMGLEHLQTVLRPKVEGSINLDKLFQDNSLDFFLFFSSVTSVVGTPGQAAYSAANLFMASLAEQRRRRGLQSAVLNIGPIIGAGYITRTMPDLGNMLLLDLHPLCESDFHLLIAEGIAACQSKSDRPVDITTGVKQVRRNEGIQPNWVNSPIMGHWILNNETAHVASSKSKVSLKDQLAAARNGEEVFSLVRGAILGKLFALLRLETDVGNFDDGTWLDELGVDSLMATELRSFLMKVFNVNVPVLRIMGGISFKELAATVVDVLDPSMIPNAKTKSVADVAQISSDIVQGQSGGSEHSAQGSEVSNGELGEQPWTLVEPADKERKQDTEA